MGASNRMSNRIPKDVNNVISHEIVDGKILFCLECEDSPYQWVSLSALMRCRPLLRRYLILLRAMEPLEYDRMVRRYLLLGTLKV